jgi:SOS-response transcriptional repressor LexA
MPGRDALERLREAMKADHPPVPFVGAGLSMAITKNKPTASWTGLLRDGIKECEREVSQLPPEWANSMNALLDHSDVIQYISVADQIRRRLYAAGGERRFDSWLKGAVGELEPTPEGKQIIQAVRGLSNIVVTTNYDTLIEGMDPAWKPYTWTDPDYRYGLRLRNAVLHMHGVVGKPASIILSSADYERIGTDKLALLLNGSFFASLNFLYIGCGDGLNDPHIALLMELLDTVVPQEGTDHYILVRGSQLRQLLGHRLSHLISPVAYGNNFQDLGPFLQELAKREEIDVSQDPKSYENVSSKPRTTWLDLAAPAEEKIRRGMDTLQRALHAMGQVEHRGTAPTGMRSWDYEDRRAVHEQLAASVSSPAVHLEACAARIVPEFTDMGAEAGQLTAAKFAEYATELEPMIQAVSELADRSSLLLTRVMVARDDLRIRTRACADYRGSYESLRRAQTSIDEGNSIVASLSDDLNRLREGRVSEPPQPVRDSGRQGDLFDSSSELNEGTEAVGPQVQVLGKVAAGEPILIDGEDVEDLPLPTRYADRTDIYALKVRGESMTGSGLLTGDYIIVVRGSDWNNGDMVVVSFPGDDGEHRDATVKLWRRRRGIISLESTNPRIGPIILKPDLDAVVEGKVIGVQRWRT